MGIKLELHLNFNFLININIYFPIIIIKRIFFHSSFSSSASTHRIMSSPKVIKLSEYVVSTYFFFFVLENFHFFVINWDVFGDYLIWLGLFFTFEIQWNGGSCEEIFFFFGFSWKILKFLVFILRKLRCRTFNLWKCRKYFYN